MNLKPLLQIALRAAVEASEKILSVRKIDYNIEYKADESPVTEADEAAHSAIKKHLSDTPFPVLSEEGRTISWEERKNWKQLWIVDPLDGTKEFIRGRNEFTVNIALVSEGVPVLGIIAIPVQEKVYWASKGNGARVSHFQELMLYNFDPELGLKLPTETDEGVFRVAVSRSHLSGKTKEYVEELEKSHPDLELVKAGSAVKFCLIAEGDADCYPRFSPCMEWDTAAGHALLLEIGKDLIDQSTGERMIYNRRNLINKPFIAG